DREDARPSRAARHHARAPVHLLQGRLGQGGTGPGPGPHPRGPPRGPRRAGAEARDGARDVTKGTLIPPPTSSPPYLPLTRSGSIESTLLDRIPGLILSAK